jgi:hypothetical protein
MLFAQGCHLTLFDVSQGCQMDYFKTKNPNLGIFWRALEGKMLAHFMAVRHNL